jgi:hypothetical protein
MSHPVANYLHELHLISGVIHPSNNGAGIPDDGLYSAKELKKNGSDEEPLVKLKPERGLVEVVTQLKQVQPNLFS